MTWEIILTVVFAILTIVGSLVSYYYYIKSKITRAVAGEIDNAETDTAAEGAAKKAEVIAQLKKLIPAFLKPFITHKMLDALVQSAFDGIERYAKKQIDKKKENADEDN